MGKFLEKFQAVKEARLEEERKIAKAAEESVIRYGIAFEREKRRYEEVVTLMAQVMENIAELTDLRPKDYGLNAASDKMSPLDEMSPPVELFVSDNKDLCVVYGHEVRAEKGVALFAFISFFVGVVTKGQLKERSTVPWEDDAKTVMVGQVYLASAAASAATPARVFWLTDMINPFDADIEELVEAFAAGCAIAEAFIEGAKNNEQSNIVAVRMESGIDEAMKVFKEYIETPPKTLYPVTMPGGKKRKNVRTSENDRSVPVDV